MIYELDSIEELFLLEDMQEGDTAIVTEDGEIYHSVFRQGEWLPIP